MPSVWQVCKLAKAHELLSYNTDESVEGLLLNAWHALGGTAKIYADSGNPEQLAYAMRVRVFADKLHESLTTLRALQDEIEAHVAEAGMLLGSKPVDS